MADVFISYKQEERDKIERLAGALTQLGLTVWFDYQLAAGDQFQNIINRELGAAKAVVVCWSAAASESEWVQAEADKAKAAEKFVSAKIEPCEPPLPYNIHQWADLTSWTGVFPHEGFRRLVNALSTLVDPALKQRYAELCASDQKKIKEELDAQFSDAEDDAEADNASSAPGAEYVLRAARNAGQSASSSNLGALISQALYEEEILRDERTRWIVAGGDGALIDVPENARLTRSLNEAVEKAEDGDCIVILPGTYRGRFSVSRRVRMIGFSVGGGRPVLTGNDNGSFVLQIAADARIENLEIESRQRGHAVLVAGDSRPTLIRCIVSRHQLVPDERRAALHAQTGTRPSVLACTVSGMSCPAIQFAGNARGEVISTYIRSREMDAVILSGGAKPHFSYCSIQADQGHAVISNANASGTFENCSLRATQSAAILNESQSFSRFMSNRVSARRAPLIEVHGFARGRFERNRLEPCPELRALAHEPPPRKPLFGRPPKPPRIPSEIEVSPQHRARFAENRLPDGSVAKPVIVN